MTINPALRTRHNPSRTRVIVLGLLVLAVAAFFGHMIFKWTVMRVYVGPGQGLIVTSKFGDPLPPDHVVVPAGDNDKKGVQEEVLGPGRYFINPVEYETEIVDLLKVPAGDPTKWVWDENGQLLDTETAPKIALLVSREGKSLPPGIEVGGPGEKGIQRRVLTPGVYKINKYQYEWKLEPAIVVPPGSVGVVTRLTDDAGDVASAPFLVNPNPATLPTSGPSTAPVFVVGSMGRGVLPDVLQPGVYYLNPRLFKVNVAPVGYDAIALNHADGSSVKFYSKDGYLVEADFTVVWGRSPADAPKIVALIGSSDKVESNVINPAMKAACQNEGAKYSARELIQGDTRSAFQDDLSQSLERQVGQRNVHILLALIRNISIKDNSGLDQTDGLMATIQRANVEIEKELTNRQKTVTAMVAAQLEQASKLVDVARETVSAESNVKVANILAEGEKKAAEIVAQKDLDVAEINLQIARLEARRTQLLGKAGADVMTLKNDAEAQGAKLLVDAFGSPAAYNNYIFAKNFQPTELKLIFAGPGTFWTDLKGFQDIAASKVLTASDTNPLSPAK